ncbi:MAG TPA: lanthionine synthetase LanC family protein [Gemmatimonadaceae bacterium]|nr:lanthionine synthetase LanC family protein [Gemmatimonadaceae bacterium]
MSQLSRRDLLRACACAGVALPALPRALLAEWRRAVARGLAERPYLDAALRAERWIRSTAITTTNGRTWPCTPGDARRGAPERSLYSGVPGVILFYLELYAATGEHRFLDEGVRGALDLAATIPEPGGAVRQAGLYEGLAGHVFVLRAAHRAAGREELRAAARRGANALAAAARAAETGGVAWNDSTDIIAGSAGIGLVLLTSRDLLGDQATALARRAADRLLALAKPVADGQRRWMPSVTLEREYPNFSHGTAGVAYFLATLAQQGGESAHLEAATDGARYLRAIAVPSGDGIAIRHHRNPRDDDGADLFYLSWCHGAAGTARLFERLGVIDGDVAWRTTADALARGTVAQGVPEQRTAGFWNNISQCCGNAGVAEYFLVRHERSNDARDLAQARRHADDLLLRGTTDGHAERWVQAENRVSPTDVAAQTGWMQGAAGVGAMLLHLDTAMRGERPTRAVTFPDSLAAL